MTAPAKDRKGKKNRNLRQAAKDILDLALIPSPEFPTSADLTEIHDLSEQQLTTVKAYTKELAASRNVVWGYHPQVNGFRVAPSGDSKVYREMQAYAFKHGIGATNALQFMLTGAHRQGFLSLSVVTKGSSYVSRSRVALTNGADYLHRNVSGLS